MLRRSARLEARQLQASETTTFPTQTATTFDTLATKPAAKRKRLSTKKQKDDEDDIHLQDDADYHGLIDDAETTTASTPKGRSARKAKKAKPSESTPPSTITIPDPTPINKSDPCTVLPTEIWHQVLTHLPLSIIARASTVSKAWLDGTRSYPVWKVVCETGGLGAPKQKYKSYMALACAQSFWVCEGCFRVSKGRPRGSNIPLPVCLDKKPQHQDDQHQEQEQDNVKKEDQDEGQGHGQAQSQTQDEDQGQGQAQSQTQDEDQGQAQPQHDSKSSNGSFDIWLLCTDCRKTHFDDNPEAISDKALGRKRAIREKSKRVTKSCAVRVYGLTEFDLSALSYQARRNPYYRYGWPMRLYDRIKVQNLALGIHAGWIGVAAVQYGLARKRQALFKERSAADRVEKRKGSDAEAGAGLDAEGSSHEQQE